MPSLHRPPAPDLEMLTREATIVPDTNVLHGLYRLSPKTRTDTLNALTAVKDRLWLPNRVSVELWQNVDSVRGELPRAYDTLLASVTRLTAAAPFGQGIRHQESREAVVDVVRRAVDSLQNELAALRGADEAIVDENSDPILDALLELFEGRVGVAPSSATIRDRVEDFHAFRAPNEIPPGYADVKDKTQPLRAAGDYLIWAEILDHAAETGHPVLLVTEDNKDDWWRRSSGKTTGPRWELIAEFAAHSSAPYHQVTTRGLVEIVGQHLGVQASNESVEELQVVERELVPSWPADWLASGADRSQLERNIRTLAATVADDANPAWLRILAAVMTAATAGTLTSSPEATRAYVREFQEAMRAAAQTTVEVPPAEV